MTHYLTIWRQVIFVRSSDYTSKEETFLQNFHFEVFISELDIFKFGTA